MSYFYSSLLKTDNKGRNFLHLAVIGSDMETVLGLLSVNVNVNSRVQDGSQGKTSLHLAVDAGNEMILRNLVSYHYSYYASVSKITN